MYLDKAIQKTAHTLINTGYDITTEKWQGVDNPPAMWESLNVVLNSVMPQTPGELTRLVKPNLPWAENHFRERISGKPLNPGNEYKNWPYYKRDAEMRTEGEKFTHSYMERFWPKYAGGKFAENDPDATKYYKEKNYDPNKGVRYTLGDFNDLLILLKKEPHTRQAYLPIWFPEDTGVVHGGRVPCSLGYYFIMRRGYLHLNYYIRSCDFLRHFKDDIYMAVRLAQELLNQLRYLDNSWDDVELGTFNMYIGSLHIFLQELNIVKKRYEPDIQHR